MINPLASIRNYGKSIKIKSNHSVGDITIECKPPRRGRFTINYIEADQDQEDDVLQMKLRGREPKGGLGPIVVNRHNCVTCIIS